MNVDLQNADDILRYCHQLRLAARDNIADLIRPLRKLDYGHCTPEVQAAVDDALFFGIFGRERSDDGWTAPGGSGGASATEPREHLQIAYACAAGLGRPPLRRYCRHAAGHDQTRHAAKAAQGSKRRDSLRDDPGRS